MVGKAEGKMDRELENDIRVGAKDFSANLAFDDFRNLGEPWDGFPLQEVILVIYYRVGFQVSPDLNGPKAIDCGVVTVVAGDLAKINGRFHRLEFVFSYLVFPVKGRVVPIKHIQFLAAIPGGAGVLIQAGGFFFQGWNNADYITLFLIITRLLIWIPRGAVFEFRKESSGGIG